MTALETSPTTAAPSCPPRPLTADVDSSTRAPVLLMAFASVKWLAVALLAATIATLKLHMPGFLAGIPALTYGRLVAIQDSVLFYGFAAQAAMAVALWLICRLGATTLVGRGASVIAGLVWNVGVLMGFIGILAGEVTPYEHFQFPHGAMVVLLLSYCLYGVSALLTFWSRKECTMYPSLWFVFAGLVFFPWILATAMMTLWSPLVRGSVASLIALWAGRNIEALFLGTIALGAIYYFLPKLSGRNLYSYGLAVFAFWFTVFFSQSSNMHAQAAFPAWVAGLSEITTILLLIPAAATAINWFNTLGGAGKKLEASFSYLFIRRAGVFYLWSVLLCAIAALRPVNRTLEFTFFQQGLSQLALLGFVGLAFLGAFTYIVPRVMGFEWPQPRLTSLHYRLSLYGAVLIAHALLIGGLIQGSQTAGLGDFASGVHAAAMIVGLAIIGYLMMLVGQIAFLVHCLCLGCSACCSAKEGGRR